MNSHKFAMALFKSQVRLPFINNIKSVRSIRESLGTKFTNEQLKNIYQTHVKKYMSKKQIGQKETIYKDGKVCR